LFSELTKLLILVELGDSGDFALGDELVGDETRLE
jgi:hypothetical protein